MLSRRERQIMDVVLRHGEASVSTVLQEIEDPPSYSALRTTMGILVDKNQLRVRRQGRKYIYTPTVGKHRARRSALRHLLDTFFEGSAENAVEAILKLESSKLSQDDFDRIASMIEDGR